METLFQPLYALLQAWVPFEWAQFAFVWRAIGAMLIIAPLCASLGVHVVNFRMAFFSDAISHSTFTGVALGVLLGVDPLVTLIGFGILAGLSITLVKDRSGTLFRHGDQCHLVGHRSPGHYRPLFPERNPKSGGLSLWGRPGHQ